MIKSGMVSYVGDLMVTLVLLILGDPDMSIWLNLGLDLSSSEVLTLKSTLTSLVGGVPEGALATSVFIGLLLRI